MTEVLVIGSINIDKIITVPHIPQKGETILGEETAESCGGKGANQAYAAAKLGANVTMLGAVGDDAFGRKSLENLRSVGVDTDHILISKRSTGNAVILVTDKGDNLILVMPEANKECTPEYLKHHNDLIKGAKIILMQLEIPMDSVKYVLENKSETSTLILDPAPFHPELSLEDLKHVDILTPNETELQLLLGKTEELLPEEIQQELSRLLAYGLKHGIVTMGDRGGFLVNEKESTFFESVKVNAVDSTAAGDTFNGALASRLAKGWTLKEAIAWANQAAAISVTRLGAQDSIPDEEEVQERVKRNK